MRVANCSVVLTWPSKQCLDIRLEGSLTTFQKTIIERNVESAEIEAIKARHNRSNLFQIKFQWCVGKQRYLLYSLNVWIMSVS